jgi:hypothetical protein
MIAEISNQVFAVLQTNRIKWKSAAHLQQKISDKLLSHTSELDIEVETARMFL